MKPEELEGGGAHKVKLKYHRDVFKYTSDELRIGGLRFDLRTEEGIKAAQAYLDNPSEDPVTAAMREFAFQDAIVTRIEQFFGFLTRQIKKRRWLYRLLGGIK